MSSQVFVGRSSSAHGPFVDKNNRDLRQTGGTLVLASHGTIYAPGGQAIFTDSKSGKDIFVYHYIPTDSARPYDDSFASLGLNAIDWSSVSLCSCVQRCGWYLMSGFFVTLRKKGVARVDEHLKISRPDCIIGRECMCSGRNVTSLTSCKTPSNRSHLDPGA